MLRARLVYESRQTKLRWLVYWTTMLGQPHNDIFPECQYQVIVVGVHVKEWVQTEYLVMALEPLKVGQDGGRYKAASGRVYGCSKEC